MIATLTAAFVTFFVVIDPVGLAPVFGSLTAGYPPARRRRTAAKSVLIAGGVLLAFALSGQWLLGHLGVGIPAFRIAGGILLLLLSIDMVMARSSGLRTTTPPEDEEAGGRADVSVFPLAIPLLAGPGAMTSVVLLFGGASGDLGQQLAILAVLGAVLVTALAFFLVAGTMLRLLGVTGINVASRVMGVLLAALAVQFIVDGALEVLMPLSVLVQ
jgi:multiple antibiotic resistance protein